MKVADILKSKGDRVVTARLGAQAGMVAHRMKAEGIGAVVIVGPGDRVAGVLSETDIVRALASSGAAVLEMSAEEIMRRSFVTCTPDHSVKEVMALMTRHKARHLPVLEGGRMVGIVSIGDIVKNRLDDLEMEANVLRDAFISSH